MADTYGALTPGATDPPLDAIPIDYSGGNQDLTVGRVRGVYISTTGHLKVDMVGRNGIATVAVTFTSLTAGIQHGMQITKIYQTGSTAAGLVLY